MTRLEDKSVLAALIRKGTGVRNPWDGDSNVVMALRQVRESRKLVRRRDEVEREVRQ